MEQTVERHYPVTVGDLYGILTSKAFFEQRFAWGRVEGYRFEAFAPRDGGMLIRIAQPITIRLDKVPGFARKFLPGEADLTTEFHWRPVADGYLAGYRFVLGRVPVNVGGTMALRADGEQAVQTTRVAVKSSVPLVGRRLEGLIAERFEEALDGDYRHTLRYIEEHHFS